MENVNSNMSDLMGQLLLEKKIAYNLEDSQAQSYKMESVKLFKRVNAKVNEGDTHIHEKA